MVAGECGAIAYAMVLAPHLALRAVTNSVREPFLGDVVQASIIVRKLVIEILDAVPHFFGDALFDFHISLTE
jgi:hypothetical protein